MLRTAAIWVTLLALTSSACADGVDDYTVVGKRIDSVALGERVIPTFIVEFSVAGRTESVTYTDRACYDIAKIGDQLPETSLSALAARVAERLDGEKPLDCR